MANIHAIAVRITSVNDGPQDFYVQYDKNMDKIQNVLGSLRSSLLRPLSPEHYVIGHHIALRGDCEQHYRGIITGFREGEAQVHLFDYGCSTRVPLLALQELPKNLIGMPALAHRFRLANLQSMNWNPAMNKAFEQFVKDKLLEMQIVEPDGKAIGLQRCMLYWEGSDILHHLSVLHCSEVATPLVVEYPKATVGSKMQVMINAIDTSGVTPWHFQVVGLKTDEFKKLHSDVQQYCTNSKPNNNNRMVAGSAIFAFDTNTLLWRRSIICGLSNHMFEVKCVDSSLIFSVSSEYTREAHIDLVNRVHPQTLQCQFQVLCDVDIAAQRFSEICMQNNGPFMMTILENDPMYVVTLFDVSTFPAQDVELQIRKRGLKSSHQIQYVPFSFSSAPPEIHSNLMLSPGTSRTPMVGPQQMLVPFNPQSMTNTPNMREPATTYMPTESIPMSVYPDTKSSNQVTPTKALQSTLAKAQVRISEINSQKQTGAVPDSSYIPYQQNLSLRQGYQTEPVLNINAPLFRPVATTVDNILEHEGVFHSSFENKMKVPITSGEQSYSGCMRQDINRNVDSQLHISPKDYSKEQLQIDDTKSHNSLYSRRSSLERYRLGNVASKSMHGDEMQESHKIASQGPIKSEITNKGYLQRALLGTSSDSSNLCPRSDYFNADKGRRCSRVEDKRSWDDGSKIGDCSTNSWDEKPSKRYRSSIHEEGKTWVDNTFKKPEMEKEPGEIDDDNGKEQQAEGGRENFRSGHYPKDQYRRNDKSNQSEKRNQNWGKNQSSQFHNTWKSQHDGVKQNADDDQVNQKEQRQNWGDGQRDRSRDRNQHRGKFQRNNSGDRGQNWTQQNKFSDRNRTFGNRGFGQRKDFGNNNFGYNKNSECQNEVKMETESTLVDENWNDEEIKVPAALKMKKLNIVPGNKINVIAVFVTDLTNFYLQLISPEFDKLLEKIQEAGAKNTSSALKLNIGDACLAEYKEDHEWYRAEVLGVLADGKLKVKFVDFGNIEDVGITTQVKPISLELTELPGQAIHCSLRGVVPANENWSTDELEKFSNHIADKNLQVEIVTLLEAQKFSVILKEEATCINEMFGASSTSMLASYSLPYPDVPDNSNVSISWFMTPGNFCVLLKSMEEEFKSIQKAIKELEITGNFETVSEGTYVLAPLRDAYFRAKVVATKDNKARVLFIDVGNIQVVLINKLRPMPDTLLASPCLAIPCAMFDIAPIPAGSNWPINSNEINVVFRSSPSFALKTYSKLENGKWEVDLLNNGASIAENLVSSGLAIKSEEESLESGGKCRVFVSYSEGLEFFIQRCSQASELEQLQSKLQSLTLETAPAIKPSSNGLVVAKNNDDGVWYRATVKESVENGVVVFFVDYGNCDIVQEVRELPSELMDLPSFATKCVLPVSPKDCPEAITKFETLAFDENACLKVHVYQRSADRLTVDLFALGKSLLQVLSSETEVKSLIKKGFVSSVDTFDSFYIQYQELVEQLQEMESKLASVDDSDLLESVSVGQLCLAKFTEDDAWYRAIVTSVIDGTTTVTFIDYGNAATAEKFKIYPVEWENISAFATCCQILGKPKKLNEFLITILDGTILFEILVHFQKDNKNVVSLFKDGKLFYEVNETAMEVTGGGGEVESVQELDGANNLESFRISYFNSVNSFYIQLACEHDTLSGLQEQLKSTPFEGEESTVAGELYMIEHGGVRYRAKQLDAITAHLVDTGDSVTVSNFSKLPTELSEVAPLAYHCSLLLDQQFSEDEMKLIFNILQEPGAVFEAKINKSHEKMNLSVFKNGVKIHTLISDMNNFKMNDASETSEPIAVSKTLNDSDMSFESSSSEEHVLVVNLSPEESQCYDNLYSLAEVAEQLSNNSSSNEPSQSSEDSGQKTSPPPVSDTEISAVDKQEEQQLNHIFESTCNVLTPEQSSKDSSLADSESVQESIEMQTDELLQTTSASNLQTSENGQEIREKKDQLLTEPNISQECEVYTSKEMSNDSQEDPIGVVTMIPDTSRVTSSEDIDAMQSNVTLSVSPTRDENANMPLKHSSQDCSGTVNPGTSNIDYDEPDSVLHITPASLPLCDSNLPDDKTDELIVVPLHKPESTSTSEYVPMSEDTLEQSDVTDHVPTPASSVQMISDSDSKILEVQVSNTQDCATENADQDSNKICQEITEEGELLSESENESENQMSSGVPVVKTLVSKFESITNK